MLTVARVAAATVLASLALPGSALALDTYVDPDTGSDTNNCTQAAPSGAGTGPCATVGAAVAISAPSGGTVRVDRGEEVFAGTVSLSGGVSLTGQDFEPSDTGAAVIDGGGGSAVFVDSGQVAGTVQELTLRGGSIGAFVNGTIAAIAENTFDDGDGVSAQTAILLGDGSPSVRDNVISGYHGGISFTGSAGVAPTSTPTIASNVITGAHQAASTAGGGISGFANTNAVIVGNSVTLPGTGLSIGISVNGGGNPTATGLTLRRNRVDAHFNGIDIRDTGLPVSLDGDLVTSAAGSGLEFEDQGPPDAGIGDATITNATAWDNAVDVNSVQTVLTLDSSIVEDPIGGTPASCAITFSRGPTTGALCEDFQTSADPLFVNAGAGNYHLQQSSPMIEQGNPAGPGPGILDIDGDARALDATPACSGNVLRRDIGADEFAPALPTCSPPVNPTQPRAKKKKCKKAKKRAVSAKKKCKRKKRR